MSMSENNTPSPHVLKSPGVLFPTSCAALPAGHVVFPV